MMSAYSVYLTDVFGTLVTTTIVPPPHQKYIDIANQLKGYFDPIARGAGFSDGANILWIPAIFNVPDEISLAVHLVPPELQMIAKLTNAPGPHEPLGHHTGRTYTQRVGRKSHTLSEVYSDGQHNDVIAKVVFHECMHNKLNLSNEQLHPTGGLASAHVYPSTQLTTKNRDMMIAGLRSPRPQWPDVVPALVMYLNRKISGDPLWYQN